VLEVRAARLAPDAEPPRVSYAVARPVGSAVVRNRVRRQLRAAVREQRDLLRPGWGYLVRPAPTAARATYRELSRDLESTLRVYLDGAR
jgi:ribonuclease P protein component